VSWLADVGVAVGVVVLWVFSRRRPRRSVPAGDVPPGTPGPRAPRVRVYRAPVDWQTNEWL
jgi:hypothetical protein